MTGAQRKFVFECRYRDCTDTGRDRSCCAGSCVLRSCEPERGRNQADKLSESRRGNRGTITDVDFSLDDNSVKLRNFDEGPV
jgi:hypothetical protein